MRYRNLRGLWLLIALLLIVPAVQPQLTIRQVVVISLDGGRPDAILQAETPNIHALAERGAAHWQAQTVIPPATLPAHASMLTGLSVAQHGMADNTITYPCPVLTEATFLTRAQEAGYRAAMAVGKGQMCQFRQTEETGYVFGQSGDRSVIEGAISLLDEGYEVLFVHLPNPDYFGHLSGWMSDTYLYELSNTDAQIGRLLAALEERDLLDETLIIVTADHGGHGKVHGSDAPEDVSIPWIIAGPGVKPGMDLQRFNVQTADTAATVLWALGIPLPESMTGRAVVEAFDLGNVSALPAAG